MNEILAEIRLRVCVENLARSCKEEGCEASLEDIPYPRVVVDANKAFPAQAMEGQRCDYILFFMNAAEDTLFTVPIELKSGKVDASEAINQLQGGAAFANRFTPTSFRSICRPILFHGTRRIHEEERKELGRKKISFRDDKLTVKTARCSKSKNLAIALSRDLRTVVARH
ncbi:MAG: hypothetical protein OXN17_03060 [Candidatus Poribacteria bacterium]|nr:hypothetical protein [Candidatus Poribacteria bacterium]MDE0505871.1 hypothetical protein [Candidatus Poribacteria bacterium]